MVRTGLLALRVRMCARSMSMPSIRLLQSAFPGFPFQDVPVTGCGVLAYSCAAARDLHPLPIAPACRWPTIMREPNVEKERKLRPSKSTGPADRKSNSFYFFIRGNAADPTRATFSSANAVTRSSDACNCL